MAYDPDYRLEQWRSYALYLQVGLTLQESFPSFYSPVELDKTRQILKSVQAGILLISKHRVPLYQFSFDTYPVPNPRT